MKVKVMTYWKKHNYTVLKIWVRYWLLVKPSKVNFDNDNYDNPYKKMYRKPQSYFKIINIWISLFTTQYLNKKSKSSMTVCEKGFTTWLNVYRTDFKPYG